ncbi:hypothetical protein [Streptomyces sp. DH7]|uniref:hypothetical protein n=1 Tax=Streptomyces sp. DH7 TaxID=2857006 RepID=UPI001E4B0517|nr:hypothetical protein [Streptomyces sp. DH7]
MNSGNTSPPQLGVRFFDLLAFLGILTFVLALVWLGTGAAVIASIAALVGVCGRIWMAMTRPSGAARASKAKVALGPNKWHANLESESRTDGDSGTGD